MSFCFEDINCSNTKTNVTVSDSYANRPVVTQVTATQVAGIVQHPTQQQQSQVNMNMASPTSCSSPSQINSSVRLCSINSTGIASQSHVNNVHVFYA
jgi:hypothetical protein